MRSKIGQRKPVAMGLLAPMLLALAVAAAGEEIQAQAVPSEFLRYVSPPGFADEFLRPGGLYVDRVHGEVLVADSGHNRIMIFDLDGTYRFEFGGQDRFAVPSALGVDGQGFIYVLGSTREGRRLFRYDFDGIFLAEIPLAPVAGEEAVDPVAFAFDDEDRLYVLDQTSKNVLRIAPDGTREGVFPVSAASKEDYRSQMVLTALRWHAGVLYVPLPGQGTVELLSARDGRMLDHIGRQGATMGMLNFPVAVAVVHEDLVLVLDKHRFTVVGYDGQGRFIGEFGGRGTTPGWFYHPSLLASDGTDRVYVGQVFANRVQLCRIPEFIRAPQGAPELHGGLDPVSGSSQVPGCESGDPVSVSPRNVWMGGVHVANISQTGGP